MNLIKIQNGTVNAMHIDTSRKLYEKRHHTGIAYKITNTNAHKGLALHSRLKKFLVKDLDANQDYARIYAICIYYLIKDDLDSFDVLVICGDENFRMVKKYLYLLFEDEHLFSEKTVISISDLRIIIGKPNLKSYADNMADSYRKRVLRSEAIQQKGIPLNPVHVNYYHIFHKWKEIDEKIKKKNASGE